VWTKVGIIKQKEKSKKISKKVLTTLKRSDIIAKHFEGGTPRSEPRKSFLKKLEKRA